MNCLDAQHWLQERLDGRPFDRAALDAHLDHCADCAAQHAAAGRLLDGLRLLVAPQPPAGLRDQVVARVLADQRARRRRVRLLTALAVAASLLVAGLAGYSWLLPPGPPVVPPEPMPLVKTPDPAAPSLRDSMAEAGSAVVNLTRRKADETVSQTRLLWPSVTPPALDDPHVLGEPLDPPARSLREAGQNVSAGLEPVTSSARRALDLFLREIPPMGTEDKPGL